MTTIVYLDAERTLQVLEFDQEEKQQEQIDINDLSERSCDLFILDDCWREHLQSPREGDTFDHMLRQEHQNTPMQFLSLLPFSDVEELQAASWDQIEQITQQCRRRWALNHNLSSIEKFPLIIEHLKSLWQQERENFFKELWSFFHINLASDELRIIFHDLKVTEQEGKEDKNELILKYIMGSKKPSLSEGGEVEEELLRHFEQSVPGVFHIHSFQSERQELVATMNVDQSPILILARVNDLNELQKALLTGLVVGLQKEAIPPQ